MWTFTTIRDQTAKSGEQAARLFTVVQNQPSWISKAALGAAFLVFTGVVLLLVIPALLIAAGVFLFLAGTASLTRAFRNMFGFERSGRRNVRVITRRD